MNKPAAMDYILSGVFIVLYSFLGYAVARYQTSLLFIGYFTAFVLYLYITFVRSAKANIDFWFYSSIAFRLILLFSIPNLSEDVYRFIWDGRLLASGHHPFSHVPLYYINNNISVPGIDTNLFSSLNSPDYFTIYPALSQYIFLLASVTSPQSVFGAVIIFKIVILACEIGSLFFIRSLTSELELSSSRVLLYALNPLIIIELMGNLHLEALMIFFLLFSFAALNRKKEVIAAIGFSAAICVKIIPVIFIPLVLQRLGWRRGLKFCLITIVTTLLLFIPLFDVEIISGFYKSVGYYFSKFEFNASIYYIIRWLGWVIFGFNIIHYSGIILAGLAFLIIMWISGNVKPLSIASNPPMDKSMLTMLMFIHLTYCLFTTTVHPWYISTLLALSILSEFKFVVLWTAMIFLSYAGYTVNGFEENLWLTFIEYTAVVGYLAYELIWQQKYSTLRPR